MNLLETTNKEEIVELEMESRDVLVATVVVDTHPVMSARVLVTGTDSKNRKFEDWLPCLEGLNVKARDKVLIQRPANTLEPVVTGIVESSHSHRRQAHSAHSLSLKHNEALTINDHHGKAIIEIVSGDNGPCIMLHTALVELDVAGALRLEADSLQFKARQGEMTLSASGDIKVDGEMIKLN